MSTTQPTDSPPDVLTDQPTVQAQPTDGPCTEDEPIQEVLAPVIPQGPLTRARSKAIGHKVNQFVDRVVEAAAHDPRPINGPSNINGPDNGPAHPHQNVGFLATAHKPWRFLSHQTAAYGVFSIIRE